MSEIVNRRDTDHKVITRFEDLPYFGAMTDDEVTDWWEHNEVSADILTLLEATDEEIGIDE